MQAQRTVRAQAVIQKAKKTIRAVKAATKIISMNRKNKNLSLITNAIHNRCTPN